MRLRRSTPQFLVQRDRWEIRTSAVEGVVGEVWYKSEHSEEWEHRFTLKESLLGTGAGVGLYAARAYKSGEPLGVYSGSDVGRPHEPAAEVSRGC